MDKTQRYECCNSSSNLERATKFPAIRPTGQDTSLRKMEFQFDSEVAGHEGMKAERPSRLRRQVRVRSLYHKDERSPLKRRAVSSILTTKVLTDRLTGMAAGC